MIATVGLESERIGGEAALDRSISLSLYFKLSLAHDAPRQRVSTGTYDTRNLTHSSTATPYKTQLSSVLDRKMSWFKEFFGTLRKGKVLFFGLQSVCILVDFF